MVVKKSEYQNQYRSSLVRKHQETYLENLNLRYQRRDREFVHTPICWGELNDEDEEPNSSDSNDEQTALRQKEGKDSEPRYQSLAEILADAKNKADVHRQSRQSDVTNTEDGGIPGFSRLSLNTKSLDVNNSADVPEKPCDNNVASEAENKDVGDKSYSIGDLVEDENRKLNEKLAKQFASWDPPPKVSKSTTGQAEKSMPEEIEAGGVKESSSNFRRPAGKKRCRTGAKAPFPSRPVSSSKGPTLRVKSSSKQRPKEAAKSVPTASTSGRLRRPDRQAEIPKARPRPESADCDLSSRPPFLPYGAGDIEDNLAVHRTHNVLATNDVYIPALKAKTRREEERKAMRKRRELAKNREALLNKLAAIPSPRDDEDWRSEYQKQYHAYEPKEYERAVSARAVIRHSNPIRAVHRGGCLVVHVD